MGKLEARQHDQPRPVDQREQERAPAEGNGGESSETFDDGGSLLPSFRDARQDRRNNVKEHNDDGESSVDDVSQGTAPQPDRRGENYDDRGCSGRAALENEGHNCCIEHRAECTRGEHNLLLRG